jgi:hypothetical protein
VQVPDSVILGKPFNVTITLENQGPPQQASLEIAFGKDKRYRALKFNGTKQLVYQFIGSGSGQQDLSISLISGIYRDKKDLTVKVTSPPSASLNLQETKMVPRSESTEVLLVFNLSGGVRNFKAIVQNQTVTTTKSKISLPPGKHEVQMTWEDPLGGEYSKNEWLDVTGQGNIKIDAGIDFSQLAGNVWFWAGLALIVVFALVVVGGLYLVGFLKGKMKTTKKEEDS